ncbi:MAG: hypothetical protein KGJ39_08615 [Acidobacteriota bacterium]|nr:hypothetical protein [Acidobacteriota bacterium]
MTTSAQWLESFAERLGVEPPSEEERDAILALAGVAAHASERTAAPVACWMAAAAGLSVEEAIDLARQIGPQTADLAP